MKTIGITGGVGAGKSAVLKILSDDYNALVIEADKVAYELESPGGVCYDNIVGLLGRDCLEDSGLIDKQKMASLIFSDAGLLRSVNDIIHPAVKKYILERIDLENKRGIYDLFAVEAALLIQDGYDKLLDEIWLIRADESVRRNRLKSTRGYSDAKIDSIINSQLNDDELAKHCSVIIDNSLDMDHLKSQIDEQLINYLIK